MVLLILLSTPVRIPKTLIGVAGERGTCSVTTVPNASCNTGGHYTAYCRSAIDEQWYEFNDSSTKKVSESAVGGPESYILFYKLM